MVSIRNPHSPLVKNPSTLVLQAGDDVSRKYRHGSQSLIRPCEDRLVPELKWKEERFKVHFLSRVNKRAVSASEKTV